MLNNSALSLEIDHFSFGQSTIEYKGADNGDDGIWLFELGRATFILRWSEMLLLKGVHRKKSSIYYQVLREL